LTDPALRRTPLHALHLELGARMVPFAGYDMPVQYPAGIVAEHAQCRTAAALFDVSHMGQVEIFGPDAAAKLEALVPGDVQGLAPGRTRYTLFTADDGGILDDLMVTRREDGLFLVVNAGCKAQDIVHLRAHLEPSLTVVERADRALLAIQGPAASGVMARLSPGMERMRFMAFAPVAIAGIACWATRSGYTGEDGFEISVPEAEAEALARRLLAEPEVKASGLGARDSLRLEAGLCLYGHDIDTATTPIEAGLDWTIGKRRRAEGGFPGAARILVELTDGPSRRRVGIRPEGRVIAREQTKIQDQGGTEIGVVTSGGFGPTVNGPIAMGYVTAGAAAEGTPLSLIVRGAARPAQVAPLPFAPHRYHRG